MPGHDRSDPVGRRRWVRPALALVTILAAIAALAVGRIRRDRTTTRRVDELRDAAGPPSDRPIRPADLADRPAPVRRYAEAVLDVESGQRHVAAARLTQRGSFRLGGSAWRPMTATQHVSVDPPGFLWDATIAVAPRLPVRVVDAYEAGAGSLVASLLGVIPVARVPPNPAMDEAELLRYLAEAVWYPTALLGPAVTWEPIDERAARATVEDRGTTASLVFTFNERGLVERVHTPARYRQETGATAPWTGTFEAYEWRDGLRVPTRAAVAWAGPADDGPYWRARLTAVDYRFG